MATPRSKGMRRAYLKKFSANVTKVSATPNVLALRELHQRNKSFDKEIPKTKGVTPERMRVISAANKLLNKEPKDIYFRVKSTLITKIILFTSSDLDAWVFLKYNKISKTLEKSIRYPSKRQALLAYHFDRVVWSEKRKINENEAPSKLL